MGTGWQYLRFQRGDASVRRLINPAVRPRTYQLVTYNSKRNAKKRGREVGFARVCLETLRGADFPKI